MLVHQCMHMLRREGRDFWKKNLMGFKQLSVCMCMCAHAQSCYQKVKNVLGRSLNEKSLLKFMRYKFIEQGSLLVMFNGSYL